MSCMLQLSRKFYTRRLVLLSLLSVILLVIFQTQGKFAEFAGTLSSSSWAVAPSLPDYDQGVYQRHLQQWSEFAQSLNASTSEADYFQIHNSLDVFRGGINQSAVRRAGSLRQTICFTINHAGVTMHPANNSGPGDVKHYTYYLDLLRSLHPHLPSDINILVAISIVDQPRSWINPLAADVKHALANHKMSTQQAFNMFACDDSGMRDFRTLHGTFLLPVVMWHHELLPIMSAYSIPGCFAGELYIYIGAGGGAGGAGCAGLVMQAHVYIMLVDGDRWWWDSLAMCAP